MQKEKNVSAGVYVRRAVRQRENAVVRKNNRHIDFFLRFHYYCFYV